MLKSGILYCFCAFRELINVPAAAVNAMAGILLDRKKRRYWKANFIPDLLGK